MHFEADRYEEEVFDDYGLSSQTVPLNWLFINDLS
ncbi:hypothetical protein A2U01_0112561 [Trifolium medium]|uniref:Uncharacterized protein n=1 Tax=Trifolium medium TaxID=97028 RepID=A0A392VTL2_9FABA|nr:hypothetical protein [Trifolium medium]